MDSVKKELLVDSVENELLVDSVDNELLEDSVDNELLVGNDLLVENDLLFEKELLEIFFYHILVSYFLNSSKSKLINELYHLGVEVIIRNDLLADKGNNILVYFPNFFCVYTL
jgi:hypothetical protein